MEFFDEINIGDSVVKNQHSYTLLLFKKREVGFILSDSIEINHC